MLAKVSVIVPIYNVEQYLHRCIDSLIAQTMVDIEIILVNDASPDRSMDIMLEYKKAYPDRIIIIDSKENMKQGGARNLGIRAATSEYIGFVDSDDWVHPEMFRMLYETAINKSADIVSCNAYRANSDSEITPYLHRDLTSLTGEMSDIKKELFLIYGASPGVVTKIYKKSLIIDNQIWFPEKLFYEDNFWGPLIFLHARSYHHVNESFYYYYLNLNSTITRQESHHHFDRLLIEIMKLETYKKIGLFDKFKDAIEFSFIRLYYINSLHLAFTRFKNPPFNKIFEIRKYMKDEFPFYRENKYFHLFSKVEQVLTGLNDVSPYKAYEWYKTIINKNVK
ncbi:Glycosyltransferase involved in cell wall bisynthesis [Paenibacillus aquistagni]|uniref:Glycosyltransferase involved in cell wall bisynthesis n=1 Tax=Paenibacillus aquistagni TaxID=1852522 RepID=A0A1X7KYN5_9BACL|nr:Glycosyltransferase involved in cell wall bisynthesis [Paenibacillus aquistagni]